MNKNRLIVIMLVAVGALGLIILLSKLLSPAKYHISQPYIADMRYAQEVGDNTIDYYGNGAFNSYDLNTNKTKALTKTYNLPNIISIRWSSTGALFMATNYDDSDMLAPMLDDRRITREAAYWWYVSFATGKIDLVGTPDFSRVGTTVTDPVWTNNDSQFYFVQITTSEDDATKTALYTQKLDGKPTKVADIEATRVYWADSNKVVYAVSDSGKAAQPGRLATYDLNSKQTKTIISPFSGSVYINNDGSKALFIKVSVVAQGDETINDESGVLLALDMNTGKTTPILNLFSGSIVWKGNAWFALATDSKKSIMSGKDWKHSKKLSITLDKKEKLPTGLKLAGTHNDQLIAIDSLGTAYVIAKTIPKDLPVAFIADPTTINLNGSSNLVDQGISSDQIDGIKYALIAYTKTIKQHVTNITVTDIKVIPRDRYSLSLDNFATFKVAFDNQPVGDVKLTYSGLETVHLIITKDGKQLYDSGIVTPNNHN